MSSFVPKSDVAAAVNNVTSAMGVFDAASTGGEEAVARRNLRLEAMKLLWSLGDPNEDVWPRIFQINVSATIEIFTNLELWDGFAEGAAVSLAKIVEKTGGDEVMMSKVFENYLATGNHADEPYSAPLSTIDGKWNIEGRAGARIHPDGTGKALP